MIPRKSSGQRLLPDKRERQITREAISFFAELGFEGQTRELARRLGITQPLLYRYFSSKDALIDRVYNEVFIARWNPTWEDKIAQGAEPLPQRLTEFYQDYARTILTYEWVRLFMFAGLKGIGITTRYAKMVSERIHPLVIGQVRIAQGGRPLVEAPMTEAEIERLWSLHAGIVYLGIRRWIYNLPVPDDQDATVATLVASFLHGGPGAMAR